MSGHHMERKWKVLWAHASGAEGAVVGFPHEVKGGDLCL